MKGPVAFLHAIRHHGGACAYPSTVTEADTSTQTHLKPPFFKADVEPLNYVGVKYTSYSSVVAISDSAEAKFASHEFVKAINGNCRARIHSTWVAATDDEGLDLNLRSDLADLVDAVPNALETAIMNRNQWLRCVIAACQGTRSHCSSKRAHSS
ncbi:hypothetical protein BDB00DRAFT_870136 [Zychaea mexicana]|uniref:uncharacterized protein n=1 Tax=Zychaea mexicana TaxID=64656 RepID=UPI0022FE8DD9|nr:uncharacterized protein BDB00DRAFT_870136 [Zychaea mexicana]KAI9495587.1 hypothetical protein BDB00DRAFT_870136 [Zychaea mexicana]